MKKYLFIVLFTSLVGANHSFAQKLLDSLIGKWNVKEYQQNKKTDFTNAGTIEFLQDGVFLSSGTYFGDAEGLYRTDETRSMVYLDKPSPTEWKATIKNNVLQLHRVTKKIKGKSSKIHLILIRDGKDENQHIIN